MPVTTQNEQKHVSILTCCVTAFVFSSVSPFSPLSFLSLTFLSPLYELRQIAQTFAAEKRGSRKSTLEAPFSLFCITAWTSSLLISTLHLSYTRKFNSFKNFNSNRNVSWSFGRRINLSKAQQGLLSLALNTLSFTSGQQPFNQTQSQGCKTHSIRSRVKAQNPQAVIELNFCNSFAYSFPAINHPIKRQ